ncbi:MAG: MerR family transcriptional regulator [Gammaproteobacteria bacterium]|nr:MerR family transcriptional regulator [Gammaproteobacteria bacterium]
MQEQQQLVLTPPRQQGLDRSSKKNLQDFPQIPDKLYFTIGEASSLCLVKPHVLRYWEQEFPQLSPSKRRGKRRYYQRDEIILIRRIKNLLYEQGFTIDGARSKLRDNSAKKSEEFVDSSKLLKNTISQLTNILNELERG